MPTIKTIQPGNTAKAAPFTICIVANPALEAPWQSGTFVADPILMDQPGFDAAVQYIVDSLFGGLPGQKEVFLADPAIQPQIKVVSVFDPSLAPSASTSLVAQDSVSDMLVAQRSVFNAFLATYGLTADVAYAVSDSASHTRASSWYTTDDSARGGVPFSLDGTMFSHCYYPVIPGTVAIHKTSSSLTALHEFGHALSSYSNGSITDLYVDSPPAVNNKHRVAGAPIPASFAAYNGTIFASDPTRDSLGYPPGWLSYHCALNAPAVPAVMDDYWMAGTGSPGAVPEDCEHDQITRYFSRDRLLAKLGRP